MTPALPTEPFEVEIVIAGQLDARRAGWFEGFTLTSQPDGLTRLTGRVADQAALFALVSRVRDLGLQLISINRI